MNLRKQKNLEWDRALAGDFEKACTILGIEETEALSQAVRDWLKKNRLQASMETWIRGSKGPVVFQNLTMIKLQVDIIKTELEGAIKTYQACAPEYESDRTEVLKTIQRIFPTAVQLHSETRDPELEQLIKQVEALARERSP